MRPPGRSNRPTPDSYDQAGTAFSLKTIAPEPVASRPNATDWLGQEVPIIMGRLSLQGPLPRGRDFLTATPAALGRLVVKAYNDLIERYGWERISYLVRIRSDQQQLWSYVYWEEDAAPLDPGEYTWTEGARSGEGLGTRSLQAHRKPLRRRGATQAAALRYASSGGQFYMRRAIPHDADIWVVQDELILSRNEATDVLINAIQTRVRDA